MKTIAALALLLPLTGCLQNAGFWSGPPYHSSEWYNARANRQQHQQPHYTYPSPGCSSRVPGDCYYYTP